MAGMKPTNIKTVKASEARRHWSELVNQVARGETRVLIEKSGAPVAAIVPAEDLERLARQDADTTKKWEFAARLRDHLQEVPPDELDEEVDKAIAEYRAAYSTTNEQGKQDFEAVRPLIDVLADLPVEVLSRRIMRNRPRTRPDWDDEDFKILERFAEGFKDEDPEEIERQVAKAIAEVRGENRAREQQQSSHQR